jgi:hypothetical protein
MPIPVKLRDVVDQMDMLSDEASAYLNRVNGEIVFVPEGDRSPGENEDDWDDMSDIENEESADIEEVLKSDDYIALPGKYEIHEWSIMEEFAHSVDDEEASDELLTALHGRGAFRYFKDTVRGLGIQQDWYDFRDEAFKEIARDWLVAHDIPFVEDAADA